MYSQELMKFLMNYKEEENNQVEALITRPYDEDVYNTFYAPRKPVMIPIYRDK